jgi:probable rRNA maturation factor
VNEEFESRDDVSAEAGWKIAVVDRTEDPAASEKRLADVAGRVLRDEGVQHAEISVAVVDDAEMSRLHEDFLQIAGPTDVLTFPLDGDSLEAWSGPIDARRGAGRRICGEVVIGGDTAVRVAGELGSLPSEELVLYLVHGILHLCGYDDLDDLQRVQMRRREAELLELLEVSARVDE